MHPVRLLYRVLRVIFYRTSQVYSRVVTAIKFWLNKVSYQDMICYGIPVVNVDHGGVFTIGTHFSFNSGKYFNMVGRPQPCYFIVSKVGRLEIGNNVGISATAIICHQYIQIGDNVKIGGNTVIYDTDFHSLDARYRNAYPETLTGVRTKPVIIKDGAFIGAHCTILKGVTIGRNAIVGAGSVVNQDIPDEQIWLGNPAQYVRETVKEMREEVPVS